MKFNTFKITISALCLCVFSNAFSLPYDVNDVNQHQYEWIVRAPELDHKLKEPKGWTGFIHTLYGYRLCDKKFYVFSYKENLKEDEYKKICDKSGICDSNSTLSLGDSNINKTCKKLIDKLNNGNITKFNPHERHNFGTYITPDNDIYISGFEEDYFPD